MRLRVTLTAYIMLLRFTTLYLERLPEHPGFKTAPEKKQLGKECMAALDELDQLKQELLRRFAIEEADRLIAERQAAEAARQASIAAEAEARAAAEAQAAFHAAAAREAAERAEVMAAVEAADRAEAQAAAAAASAVARLPSGAATGHMSGARPCAPPHDPFGGTCGECSGDESDDVLAARPPLNYPSMRANAAAPPAYEGSHVGSSAASMNFEASAPAARAPDVRGVALVAPPPLVPPSGFAPSISIAPLPQPLPVTTAPHIQPPQRAAHLPVGAPTTSIPEYKSSARPNAAAVPLAPAHHSSSSSGSSSSSSSSIVRRCRLLRSGRPRRRFQTYQTHRRQQRHWWHRQRPRRLAWAAWEP